MKGEWGGGWGPEVSGENQSPLSPVSLKIRPVFFTAEDVPFGAPAYEGEADFELPPPDGIVHVPLSPPPCGMLRALEWSAERGVRRMIISTQVSNIAPQTVWVRLGFEPTRSYYTFHQWFD